MSNESLKPLEPQPANGPPFRIAFTNRGPEYWYNERLGWPRRTNKMLFEWRCPTGQNTYEPKRVDGVWVWMPIEEGVTG